MAFSFSAVMTQELLRKICKETGGFALPELNDQLLLQCRGFTAISSLDEYVALKCLWLQENAISKIEGLEKLQELRTLYLHQNCISKIENLECCAMLNTLNLGNNWIVHVENLSGLKNLETLTLSHCRLSTFASLEHLLEIPSLQVLDISHNKIDVKEGEDPEMFVTMWQKLPNLAVLYTHGNEVVNRIRHYRKKMISHIAQLTFLDERPVFPDERRITMAWAAGGHEAESRERTLIADEKAAELKRDMQRWKDLQEKGRELKETREREWQQQQVLKRHEDEEVRRERRQQQEELFRVEMHARDAVEVEAYRAETELLQILNGLRNLERLHTRDRSEFQKGEATERKTISAVEQTEFDAMVVAVENLRKGRIPEAGDRFLLSLARDEELTQLLTEVSPEGTNLAEARIREALKSVRGNGVGGGGFDAMPNTTDPIVQRSRENNLTIDAIGTVTRERCDKKSSPQQQIPATSTPPAPKPTRKGKADIWSMYLQWEMRGQC